MRRLQVDATITGVSATEVLTRVAQFDRYPGLAPHVRSTEVHTTLPAAVGRSSWELNFRSGLLRWEEEERFDLEGLAIDFEQVEGDFDEFAGRWATSVLPAGEDGEPRTALRFTARFDFGIESLAGILDPIAERVITETVAWAVAGLHDDVRFDDDVVVEAARIDTLAKD